MLSPPPLLLLLLPACLPACHRRPPRLALRRLPRLAASLHPATLNTGRPPCRRPASRYSQLGDATKAKEALQGLDIVGHAMVVTWTSLETPLEALAVAPPMPAMPALGGAGLPGLAAGGGLLAQAQAAVPVELPENLGEGVEGASGGVGGGLKLTGGARAALMSKLAATAGLDTSNVPQIPVPQAHTQPLVRGAGRGQRRGCLLGGPAGRAQQGCVAGYGCQQPVTGPMLCPALSPWLLPERPRCPPARLPPTQVPAAVQLEQGLLGPASPIPTQCVLLKNMFAPEE